MRGPDQGDLEEGFECAIEWMPWAPEESGSEAVVQAISGLMGTHSRGWPRPRPIGLEAVSVAAGIVAAQGTLAALIAAARGKRVARVETSCLHAALLFMTHHLAIATCGDRFPFSETYPAPGPPFTTADGHRVELEIMSGDVWFAFWGRLGVDRAVLGRAWPQYAFRYIAGGCTLPPSLHEATQRHSLASLQAAAGGSGVALGRVRGYGEVLAGLEDGALERPPWTIRSTGPGPGAGSDPGPVPSAAPAPDRPLGGFRVVEVTSRLQGPLAGLLLRQLGADVVKVEPPGGDGFRYNPPRVAGSQSAAYLAYNRGKRVVEIDYKGPEGQAQIAELVRDADVFLHNWPAGRAEKLGLDSTDLSRINPALVYAHASGWGPAEADGPAAIAGDFIVQAHAGCGDGIHPSDSAPAPSRVTLLDVIGGLLACEGILGALSDRERRGGGRRVDTSLYAGAMTLQADLLKAMAGGHERGRRAGRPIWEALDQPLPTSDGFLMITADDGPTRARLAEICGADPVRPDAAVGLIAERLRDGSAEEWERILLAANIPAAAVRTDLMMLPDDPRVGPCLENLGEACWVPAPPWRFLD